MSQPGVLEIHFGAIQFRIIIAIATEIYRDTYICIKNKCNSEWEREKKLEIEAAFVIVQTQSVKLTNPALNLLKAFNNLLRLNN